MGQQSSTALNFCCTVCSICPCCSRNDYDTIDTIESMDPNDPLGSDYQSKDLVIDIEPQSVSHHRDERTKFRAFVIAFNKQYGYLLLRAYKKGKGLHHQLPGGHLDKSEMIGVSFEEAAKRAALRELFEETGLRVNEDRLQFLKLGIKNRVYFQLLLTEQDSLHHLPQYDLEQLQYEDSAQSGSARDKLTMSLREEQEFYLKLSEEHNGFEFERDIGTAIEMIQSHSGGKNSDALTVYSQKAKHERRSRSRSQSKSDSKSGSKNKKKKGKKGKNKKRKKSISKSEEKSVSMASHIESAESMHTESSIMESIRSSHSGHSPKSSKGSVIMVSDEEEEKQELKVPNQNMFGLNQSKTSIADGVEDVK